MAARVGGRNDLQLEERQLRIWLIVGAILFAVEAMVYIPQVFQGPAATRPYAINSVVKDMLFCALIPTGILTRWNEAPAEANSRSPHPRTTFASSSPDCDVPAIYCSRPAPTA